MVDALWQHMLKLRILMLRHGANARSICFPGSVTPEWYTYKNWGPSLSVSLPQNWYNNKFMGFAVCAVSNLTSTTALRDFSNSVALRDIYNVINVHHGLVFKFSYTCHDGREKGTMIWASWKGSEPKANSEFTCLTYFDHPNELCRVEISSYDGMVCTGFGMRLVYEDDVRAE